MKADLEAADRRLAEMCEKYSLRNTKKLLATKSADEIDAFLEKHPEVLQLNKWKFQGRTPPAFLLALPGMAPYTGGAEVAEGEARAVEARVDQDQVVHVPNLMLMPASRDEVPVWRDADSGEEMFPDVETDDSVEKSRRGLS